MLRYMILATSSLLLCINQHFLPLKGFESLFLAFQCKLILFFDVNKARMYLTNRGWIFAKLGLADLPIFNDFFNELDVLSLLRAIGFRILSFSR